MLYIFINVFPPGIPKGPGFGVGGERGTGHVTGNAPYSVSSGGVSPGYGFEISGGGSYCWILK